MLALLLSMLMFAAPPAAAQTSPRPLVLHDGQDAERARARVANLLRVPRSALRESAIADLLGPQDLLLAEGAELTRCGAASKVDNDYLWEQAQPAMDIVFGGYYGEAHAQLEQAVSRIPCLDEVIQRRSVALILQHFVAARIGDHGEDLAPWIQLARRLDPDLEWAGEGLPDQGDLLWAEAQPREKTVILRHYMTGTEHAQLFLDGLPVNEATLRMEPGLHIVQVRHLGEGDLTAVHTLLVHIPASGELALLDTGAFPVDAVIKAPDGPAARALARTLPLLSDTSAGVYLVGRTGVFRLGADQSWEELRTFAPRLLGWSLGLGGAGLTAAGVTGCVFHAQGSTYYTGLMEAAVERAKEDNVAEELALFQAAKEEDDRHRQLYQLSLSAAVVGGGTLLSGAFLLITPQVRAVPIFSPSYAGVVLTFAPLSR